MLSSIPDYQHKYQSTICSLNLSLASGVPMTFFNIQKCRVIKKRQNIWKVSKKLSLLICFYFNVSVLPMRILFSSNWNLNLKPIYTTAKKSFPIFHPNTQKTVCDASLWRPTYAEELLTTGHEHLKTFWGRSFDALWL